jgi:hypothetical protein
MPLFVLTLFPPLFLGDIFLATDSSCRVFEEMVKYDITHNCVTAFVDVGEIVLLNNNRPFRSLSDMTVPREKAEALLPILLVSCLRLNSVSACVHEHKSILQPIFAAGYFFNRSKLLPFPIQSGRIKRGDMTPQAMAHLHGKRLMDLLTPSEEAFIRFVVLLDIVRYHYESLLPALNKYINLFSDDDTKFASDFLETIKEQEVGVLTTHPLSTRKPFKGYRTKDISLFMIVKKQVIADRKTQTTVVATDVDLPSGNPPTTTGVIPFTFSFPESIASIKVEASDSDSNKKKRKFSQCEDESLVSPSMAMEFDDGEFLFNYPTTALYLA